MRNDSLTSPTAVVPRQYLGINVRVDAGREAGLERLTQELVLVRYPRSGRLERRGLPAVLGAHHDVLVLVVLGPLERRRHGLTQLLFLVIAGQVDIGVGLLEVYSKRM